MIENPSVTPDAGEGLDRGEFIDNIRNREPGRALRAGLQDFHRPDHDRPEHLRHGQGQDRGSQTWPARGQGQKQAAGVYELLAKKGELDETMARRVAKFEPTWETYAKGGFAEAKRGFEDCLKILPDDGPSLAYFEQCEHFAENPPPEDWAGEWIQLTK